MQRVRRAATAAMVLVVLCLSSGLASALPLTATFAQAASVVWPPSALVVSEVQTGGAGASDEFVEIANQGAGPVDLLGLEVVYATASGSTVTRKATWASSTILDAGKRILVVNGAGSYVAMGDATYSGGFAATGGALALRIVGGSVVDAVGWGDAANAFVEGIVAPAPPAGSSLERRPGGAGGNGMDTNDNTADWIVVATPGPQNLAAPPVPDPGATPGPSATPVPTATPTSTPVPTAEPRRRLPSQRRPRPRSPPRHRRRLPRRPHRHRRPPSRHRSRRRLRHRSPLRRRRPLRFRSPSREPCRTARPRPCQASSRLTSARWSQAERRSFRTRPAGSRSISTWRWSRRCWPGASWSRRERSTNATHNGRFESPSPS